MANEAILVQQLEDRLFQVTMADGAAGTDIPKGTILKWSADPNTAAASSADGDIFAGILAEENVGGDGQTEYSVWRRGVFACKMAAGGATTLGHKVSIGGANLLQAAPVTTAADFAEHMGTVIETAGNDEVVQVLVGY
jgi:hypothetical protein